MKKPTIKISSSKYLRKKAEEQLKECPSTASLFLTETDQLKLLHELRVHQIELEMQNEELLLAQNKIEELAEKYIDLYDFAPSGFITLSMNGLITELNFSAARMLGNERSFLVKQKFEIFISEDTRTTFHLFFQNILTCNEKQTCQVKIAANGNLPIYVIINGILNQDLDLCQLTIVDNTDKILAEIELMEAKLKAEESDRLKSAFLSNMSHEIRTPMNGILGFLELLKERNLKDEKQLEYIGIIEKSGVRMLNILNEIIDISKIESGQMRVSVTNVNINSCIKECFEFFKPEAAKKNIDLKLKITLQNTNALIITDYEKLLGILTNLVKNAIKFTESGSIELGYKLNTSKTEIEFFVKDTGIGIPKDKQISIFERFIQADIEAKMAQQGAGLGLTISRAYVEMLNGKIWVESEKNIGTTFYFSLPYNQVKIAGANISEDIIEKQKPIKKLKILIVEDDENSNLLLSITINEFAKEIISVNTGYDAVEACQNISDFDLVLMDIQLPGINGYEATAQIRKFNKEVIIIAQTAFSLSSDKEKSIAAGCNDYISKPILKTELNCILQKYFTY